MSKNISKYMLRLKYKCPKCDTIYSYEEYEKNKEVCKKCGTRITKLFDERFELSDVIDVKLQDPENPGKTLGIKVSIMTYDRIVSHDDDFFVTEIVVYNDEYDEEPKDWTIAFYKTREEAIKGHRRLVKFFKKEENLKKAITLEPCIIWNIELDSKLVRSIVESA